jgi:hypothetical protein
MTPLIDADVLRYEVGSIGQDEDGQPRSFEYVSDVLDKKISDICAAAGGTEPPTLYLTGKGNFREEVAVTKPYKGQRKQEKPYHFNNITIYMQNMYDTVMVEGMEADDAMSIRQTQEEGTVICTRDKDLRMVPGWHYGWECGAQREFGPMWIEDPGFLILDTSKKQPKLTGGGEIFFWAQMLTGDQVDNIPGCKGVGPVKAYATLIGCEPRDYQAEVEHLYQAKKMSYDQFIEMGQLLWMVRELDEEGNPVRWQPK